MNEPICNTNAEQALLAYVLRDPKQYNALSDIVKPEHFWWSCFKDAWNAMGKLNEQGLGIDSVTLGDELARAKQLDDFALPRMNTEDQGHIVSFSGRAAIASLRDVRTTEGGETYAAIIQDYAAKRELDIIAGKMAEWSRNGRWAADIISDAEQLFSKFVLHSGKTSLHTVDTVKGAEMARDASERASHGDLDFPTGMKDLDDLLGIQKTELSIFAARPKQGKSSLLMTIGLNAALLGKKIKIFSLEMSNTQVNQRFASQICGIEAYRIMRGKLNDAEWEAYDKALDTLRELPISFCDMRGMTIGQMKTEARKGEYDGIIVDYIQLAEADTKNDRRDLDIGEVTRGLKALAGELNVPVLAAAQLSRAVEQRTDKRPMLSDLRESGSIENDADSVTFIYRPDQYGDDTKPGLAELIVAAHRNGPTGAVDTTFHPLTMRFGEVKTRILDVTQQYPYKD